MAKNKKTYWIIGIIIIGFILLKKYAQKLPLQATIHITKGKGIFETLPGWLQLLIISGMIYIIYLLWFKK